MSGKSGLPPRQKLKIGLVASRFNQFIVDQLVKGAQDALTRHGVSGPQQALVWVPGAFELPLLADRMARSGCFDAIVALGAVIRGGTPHFEYVAGECARGLSRVALDHGIPVSFGVLTTGTVPQAVHRADRRRYDRGGDAAKTALEMVSLLKKLK